MSGSRRHADAPTRRKGGQSARKRPAGNGRHTQLLFCLLFAFALVAGRLIWIQGFSASAYADKAFQQRLKDIELPPQRGTIYDREGEPLAVSMEARTVFVSPNQVRDKEAVAKALAETIGGDIEDYRKKLAKDSGFEYVARKVEMNQAKALEDLGLQGVGFLDDYRRLYPSGELACQVLGFVGVDDKGLAGIEAQYDDQLAGVPGVILGERDPQGGPIPGGIQKEIAPTNGHDVVLTIDKDIQYEAQVQLTKAVKEFHAKSGNVLVMNPRTGEIYAMASTPGFNPNDYGKAKPTATRNKVVCDAYEPGSTMKCMTASTVVDKGLFKPETKLDLPPTINVGGRTIHESHGRGSVRWSLTDIVTHSSNVGTVKLGLKLGAQGLYDGFSAFGLTEKTGIDFPGEAKGWLPETSQWSASSIGNIPFGQGVSVTALQLARALGAVANEGELVTPHLLLDLPNAPKDEPVWPKRRAIKKETAADVTEMLTHVVTEGTGTEAAVAGYTVAGKTGTAQKALPNGGGYAGGKYVGSFIGFLPAEDPQVLVLVTLDEPSSGYYGGTCAAPAFSRIAQFAVAHLKIPPSSNGGQKVDVKEKGVGQVSGAPAPD